METFGCLPVLDDAITSQGAEDMNEEQMEGLARALRVHCPLRGGFEDDVDSIQQDVTTLLARSDERERQANRFREDDWAPLKKMVSGHEAKFNKALGLVIGIPLLITLIGLIITLGYEPKQPDMSGVEGRMDTLIERQSDIKARLEQHLAIHPDVEIRNDLRDLNTRIDRLRDSLEQQ